MTVPRSDSDSFQQWFGASKAVDEKGRPLVLYHGSHKPLTAVLDAKQYLAVFDANTRGLPTKVVEGERRILERTAGAMWFTDSEYVAFGYADQRTGEPTVVEVHLRLLNPLNLDDMDSTEVAEVLSAARGRPEVVGTEYGRSKGIAQAIVRDVGSLIQYAKEHGYDGLIYPDTDVCGRSTHTSYVSFQPDQVSFIAREAAAPDPVEIELDEEEPRCSPKC